MRTRAVRRTIALAAAAFAALATLVAVLGQVSSGSYELWWRTTSGGGTSAGGPYATQGVIGQPLTGTSSGGGYTIASGFLGGAQVKYLRYLPQLANDGTN